MLEPEETARRRALIAGAITEAKREADRVIRTLKPEGAKRRIGKTTANDDMQIVSYFIDALGMGMEVACDTDADPMEVLRSMRWKSFHGLFPQEVETAHTLLCAIPDRHNKLPAESDLMDQMHACFLCAQQGLERALLLAAYTANTTAHCNGQARG